MIKIAKDLIINHPKVYFLTIILVIISSQSMSKGVSIAAAASNETVLWTEISLDSELYQIEALVSAGTSVQGVPLSQDLHMGNVHALHIYDSSAEPVTDFNLAWKIVLAAQNALEFEEYGKSDVGGFNTRPINFLGLYSGTRDSDNSQYFIRTVFDAEDTSNNNLLFSTGFGTRGLDKDSYRRKLYKNLILSMIFQQEISEEFQDLDTLEYEKELEQELLGEAQRIIDLANEGAVVSQELVDLVKVIVYSGNAVEKDLLNNAGVFDEWVLLAENQTFKRSLNKLKNVMGVFDTGTQVTRSVVRGLFIHSLATEEAGIRLEILEEFVQHESHRIDGQLILAIEDAREEFNNIQDSTYYAIRQALLEALPGILNLENLFVDWGIKFAQHFKLITSKTAHQLHKAFGPALVVVKISFDLEEDVDILRHASLAMTMDYYLNVYMQDLLLTTTVEEAMHRARLYNMRYFVGFYNYEYIRRALDNSWWDPLYWLNLAYLFSGQGSGFNEEIDGYAMHNLTYYRQSLAPHFLATEEAEWLNSLITTPSTPILSLPLISPSNSGDTNTEFEFSITYTHEDDVGPDSIILIVEDSEILLGSSSVSYSTGVTFTSLPMTFDVGTYFYSFKAIQGESEINTNQFTFTVNNPAPEHDIQISGSDTNKETFDPNEQAIVSAQVVNLSSSTANDIVIYTVINGPSGYSWSAAPININSLDSNQYWPSFGNLATVANWPGNNIEGEYTITIQATCPTCDQNWDDNTSVQSILVSDEDPLDYMFYQYATFEDVYYDFNPSSSPPGWSGGYFGPLSANINGNSIQAWVQPSSGGERFRAHITRNGVLCREFDDGTFDYQKTQYTCTNDTVVVAVLDYFEVHSVPEDWIATIILGGYNNQVTLTPPVQTVPMGERGHYDATIPCSNCDYRDESVYQATQGDDPPSVFFDREWDEWYDLDENPPDLSLDIEPRQEGEHNFIIDTGPEDDGGWGYFIAGKIIGYTPVDNPPIVGINSHADNQTINGTQNIVASATDDKGINKVEFYIGGALVSSDTVSPYNHTWDTTANNDGNYSISVTAYDTANQTASDLVNVIVDNNPPSITNVTHTPSSPTDTDVVLIDATISDVSGVGNAILSYSKDNGTNWTLLTMSNVNGDSWQATIPNHDQGQILYNIEATDALAKTSITSNLQYDIVDASPPVFFGWTETPSNLTEDSIGVFRITVSVVDVGGSSLVGQIPQFDYRIGTGSYDGYDDMFNVSDDTWYFDIPAQDWDALQGQSIYYQVNLTDLAGNEATSDERSEIIDILNDVPEITAFDPINLTPEVSAGSCLDFSITASDDDGDPLSYEWQVDSVVNGTSSNFTFCPEEADAGDHTIVGLARDDVSTAGQSWQVTVTVGSPVCHALTSTHVGSGSDPAVDISSSPNCAVGEYIAGELINLTATPDTGWHVVSWAGTDDDNLTTITNTLTMPASDHTVTVTYEEDSPICYALTLTHTGSGSDPVVDPTNSAGCNTSMYTANEAISLTALPDSGWHISSWSGTDDDASTAVTNTLTMPANNHSVAVNYEEDAPACYELTLTHSGEGSDPIASPTHSTNCPIGQYLASEAVNLTASPASGWHVASWFGTDDDNSSAISNTVTIPANNHTVTVTYLEDSSAFFFEDWESGIDGAI